MISCSAECRTLFNTTTRSWKPARFFFLTLMGLRPASAQKHTSGWTSRMRRRAFLLPRINLSTSLIFGRIANACWEMEILPPLVFRLRYFASLKSFASSTTRAGAEKTLLCRGCPSTLRAHRSHSRPPVSGLSGRPIGMSTKIRADSSALLTNPSSFSITPQ